MAKIFKILLFPAILLFHLQVGIFHVHAAVADFGAESTIGALKVTLSPQGAIDDGAQWKVDGGDWQESGATVSDLSIGTHTVRYNDVIGWEQPSSEFVTINNGQTTQTTGGIHQNSIFAVSGHRFSH